ncbi:uncharacterized protein LOC113346878 isoform X2 [Papaver somniferum]|uniref:uncharacterized protein LOC113346878 isoform X2 n=1 Tax=Papaver somniferum TaxID=3469 RepID=UPI000E6F4BF5|nr:uncharacterized protein LOC113346878 isoform X2 [Papaver somniferum]
MSSYDAYLQFICLYIVVSSHPPSWSTQDKIQLGFFVFGIILNLRNQFIIRPKKYEAEDEKYDLEAEMFKILGNDTTGWSKKLIEKKKRKIAALRKKIGTLQIWKMHTRPPLIH